VQKQVQKIRLGGYDLLGGMAWSALPSDTPEKKGMSEFFSNPDKGKGVSKGLIVRFGGISVVGYLKPKDKAPSLPSAQAMLAMANQRFIEDAGGLSSGSTNEEHNWIVVERLEDQGKESDDDLYWMGAVKNGVPVPVADIVAKKDVIIEEMVHLFDAGANDGFTVYTKDKDVRYNALSSVNVYEKSFTELVAGIQASKAKPNLFQMGALIAIGAILFLFLLGGAYFGYSVYAEKKALEEAAIIEAKQKAAKAAQKEQEEKSYEQSVKELMLTSLKLGADEVQAGMVAPSASNTIAAWRDLVYRIDLDQSGWKLKEINCLIDTDLTPKCRLDLMRGQMGINSILLADRPDVIIEGDDASYMVSGPAIPAREATFASLGSANEFSNDVVSELQMLRAVDIEHDVRASKDIVKNVTLPPPPSSLKLPAQDAKAPPLKIQMGAATGMATVSGSQLWQMSGIAEVLEANGVRVKDVKITINPDNLATSSWVISFDYFVRTLPQPIIPPVPLGETVINVELPPEYRAQTAVQAGGVSATAGSSTAEPTEEEKAAAPSGPPIPTTMPTPEK